MLAKTTGLAIPKTIDRFFTESKSASSRVAYSTMKEFINGGFKEVIDDTFADDANSVKKVLFCSGKIYFDLAERQQKENRKDIAIIRLEQLYPLPVKQLEELYKKYNKATWFWVQEEPLNMGAASFPANEFEEYQLWSDQPAAQCFTAPVMPRCMSRNRKRLSKQHLVFNAVKFSN